MVFKGFHHHHLVMKRSKCIFGATSMAYLGHVITIAGVNMDKHKVAAVAEWLVPQYVRAVRAFLGLTGYYRRFIKDYGATTTPLMSLLKKEHFR